MAIERFMGFTPEEWAGMGIMMLIGLFLLIIIELSANKNERKQYYKERSKAKNKTIENNIIRNRFAMEDKRYSIICKK